LGYENVLKEFNTNVYDFMEEKIGLTTNSQKKKGWYEIKHNEVIKRLKTLKAKGTKTLKEINKYILQGMKSNNKIRKRIHFINRYQKKHKQFPTIKEWTGMKQTINDCICKTKRIRNWAQKQIQKLVRDAEQRRIGQYIFKNLEDYDGNPKKFFQKLKSYSTVQQTIDVLRDPNDFTNISADPQQIKKWTEEYFTHVYKVKGVIKDKIECMRNARKGKEHQKLLVKITKEEMLQAILHMKNYTAPGMDKLPPEIYKAIAQNVEYTDILLNLFNLCLQKKYMTQEWKKAYIWLIHKKGDAMNLENYRPISLLNAQYKIFSTIITRRLEAYMSTNKFLSNSQLGFRRGMSTTEAINTLIHIYQDRKNNRWKKNIHTAFIDQAKAFDSVRYDIIQKSLKYYDVPQQFCEMIAAMYEGNTAQIITNAGLTENIPIKQGVRQGDVLSPLLYIIAINPILENINKEGKGYQLTGANGVCLTISVLAYADDIVLLASSRKDLIKMLQILKHNLDQYGININYDKSRYSSSLSVDTDIFLDKDHKLKYLHRSKSYRYLGLNINIQLDWKQDQSLTLNRLKYRTGIIKYKKLSPDIKIYVINKVIIPAMEYHMQFYIYNDICIHKIQSFLELNVRKWLKISEKTHHSFIYLRQENFGLGLHNIRMVNERAFMANILNNCLNTNNNQCKQATSIMIVNNKFIRNNQIHMLNIMKENQTIPLHPVRPTPVVTIIDYINYRLTIRKNSYGCINRHLLYYVLYSHKLSFNH